MLYLQQYFFYFSFTRMTKRFPCFINSSFNTISTNNDRDNKITETVNHILALWSETRFMPKSMAIQVQGNFWLVHQVFNTNSTKIQTHAKGWIHSLHKQARISFSVFLWTIWDENETTAYKGSRKRLILN